MGTLLEGGGGGGGGVNNIGISTQGNTGGTTGFASQSFQFVGSNNITLSQTLGAGGATLSILGPTTVSGLVGGVSTGGNTVGSTGTVSQSIVFVGGNNITLSQSTGGNSNATITISAANETQTVPPIGTAVKGVSSVGSTGTITRFAPEDHQHAGVFSLGVSTGGNTVGSTGVFPGQFVFAGGNNITLSQSTAAGNLATISISAPNAAVAASQTLGMSNIGNTSGTTGVIQSSNVQFVFAGGNNVTLSQSINGASGTLTISAFSQSIQTQSTYTGTLDQFLPFGVGPMVTNEQLGQAVRLVYFFSANNFVSASRVAHLLSVSLSTSSNSSHAGTLTIGCGIYTRNASTLSLASSSTQTYAWTNTSNNSSASLQGLKNVTIPLNISMTPGPYWLMILSSTATANANWITLSNIKQSVLTSPIYRGEFMAASDATKQIVEGYGSFTGLNTTFAGSRAFTDIQGSITNFNVPWVVFNNFTN